MVWVNEAVLDLSEQPSAEPGCWLLVGEDGLTQAVSSLLRAQDEWVHVCVAAEVVEALETMAAQAGPPLRGVLHLGSVSLGPDALAQGGGSQSVLSLQHALTSNEWAQASQARLWLVTSGAQRVLAGDELSV